MAIRKKDGMLKKTISQYGGVRSSFKGNSGRYGWKGRVGSKSRAPEESDFRLYPETLRFS